VKDAELAVAQAEAAQGQYDLFAVEVAVAAGDQPQRDDLLLDLRLLGGLGALLAVADEIPGLAQPDIVVVLVLVPVLVRYCRDGLVRFQLRERGRIVVGTDITLVERGFQPQVRLGVTAPGLAPAVPVHEADDADTDQ